MRSKHAGGLNMLFGDGDVRFIKNSTSGPTWWAVKYRGRSGVAKGKYSVLVSKTVEGGAGEAPADSSGEFSEAAALAAMKKQADLTAASVKQGARKSRPVIVTETFEREVGDKATVFDFDLKKP